MKLKCIAIDDEPLALDLLCRFIEKTPFLILLGSFSSSIEALSTLQNDSIDVIFLDIQMSDLNGIELATMINKRSKDSPKIVFTTAYNHFALEGYKVNAIDYLLKPYNYNEFLHAADKARYYASLESKNQNTHQEDDHLFLKVEQEWVKVKYKEIGYIEALKDYVKVYLTDSNHPVLSLMTMKSLEEKLPSELFMRIHRSYIISLDKIASVTKTSVTIDDIRIPIGEQYKNDFKKFMGWE